MEVWRGSPPQSSIRSPITGRTTERYAKGRQEHCFSAEFLMGQALLNNLSNLGLVEKIAKPSLTTALTSAGPRRERMPPSARWPRLRLAACFLDSCATLDLPMCGYGILYRTACSAALRQRL